MDEIQYLTEAGTAVMGSGFFSYIVQSSFTANSYVIAKYNKMLIKIIILKKNPMEMSLNVVSNYC